MPLLPIAFNSYTSRSLPYSAQRLINLYWESAPDGSTKSQGVLFRRPGLRLKSEPTIGFEDPISPGGVRGAHMLGATPYYFIGQKVFIINQNGSFTELTGDDIIGSDLIDTADNGSQIAVVSGGAGYIVEGETVTRITDEGFRPVSSVTYQDTVFIWTEENSERIFISPPFQGLGPYDTLDFATAELEPDNLVKVFSDKDDLFLMGRNTIEPWYGSGDIDFPFAPNPGAATEYGVLARNSVRKLDNTLMWLGSDERGGAVIYRMGGYSPQRISTHALESQWEKASNLQSAFAFTFRMEGHNFYVFTIPDFGTYVYDGSTNLWCEWRTDGRQDWEAVGFVYAYGRWMVGSRFENKIYQLSVNFYDDDGDFIEWEATSPPVHTPNNAYARHNFLRIDIGAGVGLTDGQGSDPQFFLQWADEDGERFGPKRVMRMGKKGSTFTRAYKRSLGRARSRTYRISGSDPVPLSIIGAYLEIEVGRW